ncbi:MAG: FAD synthetase family protein [Treponema sp.]|nr:FAD synthetase family protein [Treponema sp.]
MQQINWNDLERLCPDNSLKLEITGHSTRPEGGIFPSCGKRTALTIGVFDGLHRGHQALIAKITEKAPEYLPTIITFRNNPKKLEGIISFEEKTALLDSLGISLAVIIDFSEHFSKINGRDFLKALNGYLCPAYMGLGENFHCGYHRDTDAMAFKALAESLGIETEIIPPVMEGGSAISSSRIREALRTHRFEEAALLLGRPL